MAEKFIVAGGDRRFGAAAERIAAAGHEVAALYLDMPKSGKFAYNGTAADVLILPLPITGDGVHLNAPDEDIPPLLTDMTALVKDGGVVFGGMVTDSVRRLFAEKNAICIDYMEREELALMNASVTAEGAILTALREQDITLREQKTLVIGMGRIGKTLIGILKGFGADVSASARKPADLAIAELMGCRPLQTAEIGACCGEYTLIFNTVPALVLTRDVLKNVGKKALIIDLASNPGGTDFKAAEELGIKAMLCPGIPGKDFPVTAGGIIADTVTNIISERRDINARN